MNTRGRLVNGKDSKMLSHNCSFQVGVSSPFSFCGGSILSSTTIVTAAHCTVESSLSDLEVIVGDHDVTIDDGEERFAVCGKVEHPDYDK
jgi:secreted trypsin-like serine protease